MTTALDFNKAKVEKVAKAKERKITETVSTDNKSVIRALARYDAAKELYASAPQDQLLTALVDSFYKNAKYQPSWEAPFQKHAPELGEALKGNLGAPQPRGRRSKSTSGELPPTTEDPEATLGPAPEE